MTKKIQYFILYTAFIMICAFIMFLTKHFLTSGLLMILLMLTPLLFVGTITRKLLSFIPLISVLAYMSLTYDFSLDATGSLVLYLSPFVSYVLTKQKTIISHSVITVHTLYLIILNFTSIPLLQGIKLYVIIVIYLLLLPSQLYRDIKKRMHKLIK